MRFLSHTEIQTTHSGYFDDVAYGTLLVLAKHPPPTFLNNIMGGVQLSSGLSCLDKHRYANKYVN